MEKTAADPSPATHIHCIPDEVLEKIFLYLNSDDLICSVLPVCRRWRDIAECRVLAKLSVLRIDNDTTLQYSREARLSLPNLRELTIDCDGFDRIDIKDFRRSCPQLISFRAIRSICCSDRNVAKMVRCWGATLQVLAIVADDLTSTGLAALAGCSHLRELGLWGLTIRGSGLLKLVTLTHLEVLRLRFADSIRPANLRKFLAHSKSARRLWKLDLCNSAGMDDSVLYVLAAACPSLEELDVSYCFVTEEGICEVLRSCHRLRSLRIVNTNCSVSEILPEIPELAPQLQELQLGEFLMKRLGEAFLETLRSVMPDLKLY